MSINEVVGIIKVEREVVGIKKEDDSIFVFILFVKDIGIVVIRFLFNIVVKGIGIVVIDFPYNTVVGVFGMVVM